jgi:hypothetical protein
VLSKKCITKSIDFLYKVWYNINQKVGGNMDDELIKLLIYYECIKDKENPKKEIVSNETFDKIIRETWGDDDL